MTEGPCITNANWSHLTVRCVKRAGDSNPREKNDSFEAVRLTVKKESCRFCKSDWENDKSKIKQTRLSGE